MQADGSLAVSSAASAPQEADRGRRGRWLTGLVGIGVVAVLAYLFVLPAFGGLLPLSDAESAWCPSHLYEMYVAAQRVGSLPKSLGLLWPDGFGAAEVTVISYGPGSTAGVDVYSMIGSGWLSGDPGSYNRSCRAAFAAR